MAASNPIQTFHDEARDLLAQIEEIALEVDESAPDPDAVNRLFRAFHTIKGSGAMFGFEAVAQFTHHVESALDRVRDGSLKLTRQLIDLILAAKDHIRCLFDASEADAPAVLEGGQRLITAIQSLGAPSGITPHPNAAAPAALPATSPASGAAALQSFQIRFRPPRGLMVAGTNPISLLNELRALGECSAVADFGAVPPLAELQPDQCYAAWDITLQTDRGLNAIKDVFIFVEDESELKISLVEPTAPRAPSASAPAATPQSSAEAAPAPAQSKRRASGSDGSVRVPSERLDRLVSLVGEMVINQARLSQVAASASVPHLSGPVEELERLVAELRDNVLGIRMMPIGTTFTRFKRLVHDLSAELGKEIDLVTEGAETELDKTVLDQLGDPFVHLIRNSVDHGIESAAAREERGKPRRGVIRLTAAHTGSNVLVTIEDDGRGLDPQVIRSKAIEKQLIAPDAVLSEKEIFNLIFLPGFSTAQKVTNVSGRGVGMDVVKRQIEALRGSVALSSRLGVGTTVSLTLPLTLAIIDGLLVEVGRDQYVIPMSAVTENVELARAERSRKNGRNVVAVRGELIPYLRLRDLFALSEGELEVEKIVIVRHEDQRVGLVVDRVLGSHQTVIQSLGRFYQHVGVVSGATIMGDGRVGLILNLPGLVTLATEPQLQRI